MANPTYFVRVKDTSGSTVADFFLRGRRDLRPGGAQWLTYRKRLRTAGAFSVQIQGRDERIPLIGLDYQVEFWRRDPYITAAQITTLPSWQRDTRIPLWYKDFEGFVRVDPEVALSQDGQYSALLRGRGYNDLLQGEEITYPVGSSQARKGGAAETVAKSYVDQNIGPNAGLDAAGNSRVRTGLTIQADAGTGTRWPAATGQADRANDLLIDVVKELAEYGPGDYWIVGTGPATFQFIWSDQQWGLDKTVGNTAGNRPILLSAKNNSAQSVQFVRNYLDSVNAINVLGQGPGGNLKVRSVVGGSALSTPWSRRARSITAREVSDDNEMDALGQAELETTITRAEISIEYKQTVGIRYGPDPSGSRGFFDVGDLITLEDTYTGEGLDKKVTGITVGVRSGGGDTVETLTPEFDDLP